MQGERWGLREEEMPAVRQFGDPEEYATLLEKYKEDFIREEATMDEKVAERERQRNAPPPPGKASKSKKRPRAKKT